MIVLDASVLIAVLDANDAHHVTAIRILEDHPGPYLVHPLTLAEVLVGPARHGRETEANLALERIGVTLSEAGNPTELAKLRAAHRLRMPDTCVLWTALDANAPLATFDARLAAVASALIPTLP